MIATRPLQCGHPVCRHTDNAEKLCGSGLRMILVAADDAGVAESLKPQWMPVPMH